MCPICKSENFIFVGNPFISSKAEKIIQKDYKVVKCLDCNFYFINPAIELTDWDWKYLYDNT